MHFDDMLKVVGEFGRYQKVQCFIVSILIINTTMHTFHMVFTAATPKHRCQIRGNILESKNLSILQGNNSTTTIQGDEPYNSCMIHTTNETDSPVSTNFTESDMSDSIKGLRTCDDGWTYDTDIYKTTIVTEWDLVCDKDWYQSMIISVFFVGRLIGSSIFGQLSDWLGRRPIFLFCIILLATSGVLASFCRAMWLLVICVFFQGLAQFGLFVCAFILGTEMVGPSYRIYVSLSIHACYAIGNIVLAGIAYFLREWNLILLTVSLSGVPLFLTYWFVPESVRWLLAKGRNEEALAIVRKMARTNGTTVDHNIIDKMEVTSPKKNSSVVDLLKSASMAKLALNVCFQGIAILMLYYGISFNTPHLSGDPYLNFVILGSSEIFGIFILFCIRKRFKQKTKYLVFMTIGALGCLAMAFAPKEYRWLTILLAFTAKFGVSGASPYLNLITLEVFPTYLRNTAFGVSKTFAMGGAMLAPYIIYLNNVRDELPEIIFGALALLAAITAWFIPDTSGMKLPENINYMKDRSDKKCDHVELTSQESKANNEILLTKSADL